MLCIRPLQHKCLNLIYYIFLKILILISFEKLFRRKLRKNIFIVKLKVLIRTLGHQKFSHYSPRGKLKLKNFKVELLSKKVCKQNIYLNFQIPPKESAAFRSWHKKKMSLFQIVQTSLLEYPQYFFEKEKQTQQAGFRLLQNWSKSTQIISEKK